MTIRKVFNSSSPYGVYHEKVKKKTSASDLPVGIGIVLPATRDTQKNPSAHTEKKVVDVTAIAVHSTEDRGHIRDSLGVGL